MNPMNYAPSSSQPTPPVVYAKGCLGAAWDDIKGTPGYVGKLVLLGLIMCVPILNFVVMGYLLHWSREVPFGGRTPMPAKYVTGKNFEFGFYAFVISLVVNIAVGIADMILGVIPFLGALVSMALMLATCVATSLMQMRMIMGLSLGEGFGLKDLWFKANRNWGQLLLTTLVPSVVVGFIAGVACFVVLMIAMLLGLGGVLPVLASSSMANPSSADVLAIVGMIAGPALFAGLLIYLILCIPSAVASALMVRGLGHWVARYAPEWTSLATPPAPVPPIYPQTPTYPQS